MATNVAPTHHTMLARWEDPVYPGGPEVWSWIETTKHGILCVVAVSDLAAGCTEVWVDWAANLVRAETQTVTRHDILVRCLEQLHAGPRGEPLIASSLRTAL